MTWGGLFEILKKAGPLVGVGPRVMHPEYLKVLVTGRMMDADAMTAVELYSDLGKKYLGTFMPA